MAWREKDRSGCSYRVMGLIALIVGLNLRPILAAIGPLLADIQTGTGLTSSQVSLLTSLPIVVMGFFALASGCLQQRLGESRGISLGLGIIALASAARGYFHDSMGLILTAALGGVGIALIQALMPSYVKSNHPAQASRLMGLFTTGIMAGAAIAVASAAPLSRVYGWPSVLAIACIPALVALCIWSRCANGRVIISPKRNVVPLKSGRAWLLLTFFGLGTAAYTLVLAWLPSYYVQLGWNAEDAGYLLGALTLIEVIAGLLVSILIGSFPDRRAPLAVVLMFLSGGLICLTMAPLTMVAVAVALLGFGIGALFPLSLIVTLDHADSPSTASSLLGFVQGGGYLIAGTMPYIAGMIREHTDSLEPAWWVMQAGVVVLLVMVFFLRPRVGGSEPTTPPEQRSLKHGI